MFRYLLLFLRSINSQYKMAKKTKSFGGKILFFILGMLAMLVLDMIFNFNNSVEKQLNRELNKAERKIEDVFKN